MGLNTPILREGDHGPDVTRLQRQLSTAGHTTGIDGLFGPATESALRDYQHLQGLVADGIAGPKTWAMLGGKPLPATLKQADLIEAADTLDIDLAALMAVNEVESRGRGFIGRLPVVLFERHIMYRRLEHNGRNAAELAAAHPRLVNTSPGGYTGGTAENVRLNAARRIDDTSGAESASYGLFQIMGYHATRIGYDSVTAFADAMAQSEAHQLHAFIAFIQADKTLLKSLRAHKWAAFAKRYNGPAYARNDYDHKLAAAHRRHARHLDDAPEARPC